MYLCAQHGLEVGDDAGFELLRAAHVEHLDLLFHHAGHSETHKVLLLWDMLE